MKLYKPAIYSAIAATTLPFMWLFTTLDLAVWDIDRALFITQLSSTLGAISGFIGMVLFLWGVILGSREFSRMLTTDTIWVNKLHIWLGTYGSIFILVHPFLEMYSYGENIFFLFAPSFATNAAFHLTLGRLAFILFLVIFITSALVRGNIKYRPWKYIHYLAYPMILATFIHAQDIGATLTSYPTLSTLWKMLLVSYIVFIGYRLFSASGLGKAKYTIQQKMYYGDHTVVFTIAPTTKYSIPAPGQYYQLQRKRFGETHPFSIMQHNSKDNSLTFGVKDFGKYSHLLQAITLNDTIYLDGPYGTFTAEAHNPSPKVLIAGGIGITPFVDVVNKHSNEDTYLLNCNKHLSNAVYRNELRQQLGNHYTDIISDQPADELTEPNVLSGRLSAELIKQRIPEHILQEANFFYCGPTALYEALCEMLDELGVPQSHIYYEEFSF